MVLGSSNLHNSSARGLHKDDALEPLRLEPTSATAMPRMSVSAVGASLGARTEPVVVTGAAKHWRASYRWVSSKRLREYYGDMPFKLSDDVRLTLNEYLDYSAAATADFPY